MSLIINNKLSFTGSFQLSSSPLDSFVRNFNEDDFKYLSQQFHKKKLDPVKQKRFYPYEYMSHFENFKDELPSKERFYSSLTKKKINGKEYKHVLNV